MIYLKKLILFNIIFKYKFPLCYFNPKLTCRKKDAIRKFASNSASLVGATLGDNQTQIISSTVYVVY